MLDNLNKYKYVIVIGVVIVGMLFYMTNQSKVTAELKAEIATKQGLITDTEKTLRLVSKEFDKEEFVEKVETRESSAKKIGAEKIAVDDALSAYYKASNPLPTGDAEKKAYFAKLEEVKAENTRLTGASEADHISTWKLNPEWTLKLESVVSYRDVDKFPILFSMTTKDGKSAGLVRALYDVNKHLLSDIVPQYTPDGLRDQADIGGD